MSYFIVPVCMFPYGQFYHNNNDYTLYLLDYCDKIHWNVVMDQIKQYKKWKLNTWWIKQFKGALFSPLKLLFTIADPLIGQQNTSVIQVIVVIVNVIVYDAECYHKSTWNHFQSLNIMLTNNLFVKKIHCRPSLHKWPKLYSSVLKWKQINKNIVNKNKGFLLR